MLLSLRHHFHSTSTILRGDLVISLVWFNQSFSLRGAREAGTKIGRDTQRSPSDKGMAEVKQGPPNSVGSASFYFRGADFLKRGQEQST